MKTFIGSAAFAATLLAAGCASQSEPRARGTEIYIRYAEVIAVERAQLPSAAPVGAVVGGFTGLVLSRNQSTGRRVASGIGGAALGGLATAALEGDRLGYSYRLRFRNGSESNFITEKGYLRVGDCVAVERGEYANVRRVADTLCASPVSAEIEREQQRSAQLCHEAKEQLLLAASDAEIEQASRKVTILCEY